MQERVRCDKFLVGLTKTFFNIVDTSVTAVPWIYQFYLVTLLFLFVFSFFLVFLLTCLLVCSLVHSFIPVPVCNIAYAHLVASIVM
jgi:hypothetical protein